MILKKNCSVVGKKLRFSDANNGRKPYIKAIYRKAPKKILMTYNKGKLLGNFLPQERQSAKLCLLDRVFHWQILKKKSCYHLNIQSLQSTSLLKNAKKAKLAEFKHIFKENLFNS